MSPARRVPGQLALFHHDPLHLDDDIDRLLGEARSLWTRRRISKRCSPRARDCHSRSPERPRPAALRPLAILSRDNGSDAACSFQTTTTHSHNGAFGDVAAGPRWLVVDRATESGALRCTGDTSPRGPGNA